MMMSVILTDVVNLILVSCYYIGILVNFQHQLCYSLLWLKMYDLMTKSLSKRQGKKERFVHHSHEKLITKMFHNFIVNCTKWYYDQKVTLLFLCIFGKYVLLFISLIVSGRYPENPAI